MLGAVLVGGASSRMGVDKATLEVDGEALGARVARVLGEAGAGPVLLIGATAVHAAIPGGAVADLWPGAGPVGGVLTALVEAERHGAGRALCLACDLPAVSRSDLDALLAAASTVEDAGSTVVLATVGDSAAPPNGVWPVALLPELTRRFEAGATSFRSLLADLAVESVEVPGFHDADEPGDLAPFR